MKKINLFYVILTLTLALGMFFASCEEGAVQPPEDTGGFRDISAAELAAGITVGWNLGNTLDSHAGTDSSPGVYQSNATVASLESRWGNNRTSKANIDAIKAAGFNAIRIPVTWYQCADPDNDYTIRADWMTRVKQVVDYAVSNDMYIFLNTHHDNSIFKLRNADMEESRKAFGSVWRQISETFKDYNEKLVFEDLNEPRTINSQAQWSGGTEEERNNLNALHQLFVDTVRATGGNNEKRILYIPTYAASTEIPAMSNLEIPDDPLNTKNKIIVSYHAYEPFAFAHNGDGTWTSGNTSPITSRADRAYELFVSRGIPVIIGEFGSMYYRRNSPPSSSLVPLESRVAWSEYYVAYAKSKGIKCVWWDDGGDFRLLNRNDNSFYYQEIVEALMRGAE
uniref:Glycoside hydrolase family 5 n=1 Tax=uncultured bacterium contig00026 TaxID=1181515 RepID=A0A806KMP5_9BACT|nr:glycoside hydrolase family 5 [uncultured bacterium contig00026]